MTEFAKPKQQLSQPDTASISLENAVKLRFGSPDSLDQDVLYVVGKVPPLKEGKLICQSKVENRNLIQIESGVVTGCLKGLPDETNNALLATFNLHQQEYPCPIEQSVERIVPLKAVRATRIVLSYLTSTEHRAEVLQALRTENFARRVETLAKIDFRKLNLDPHVVKSIAFQLGQTVALVNGHEVYTKGDLKEYTPSLAPYIDRKPADQSALNDIRDILLSQLKGVYIRQKGSLNLFMYENGPAISDWNQYARQSRGLVIDIKNERCVMFPMDKFFRFGEGPEHGREALNPETAVEIVEKVDGSMVSLLSVKEGAVFACKGNFDTEQCEVASGIASRLPIDKLDTERYWHVFEVIYPENRFPQGLAIVDYGTKEDLVLIAMRDRHTNKLLPYSLVVDEAKRVGLSYPEVFSGELKGLFDKIDNSTRQFNPNGVSAEGYIIRTADTQKYYKIKYSEYSEALTVVNRLRADRFIDDYYKAEEKQREMMLSSLPAPFRRVALQQIDQVDMHKDEILGFLTDRINNLPAENIARVNAVKEYMPKELQELTFRLIKKQPYDKILEGLAVKMYYKKLILNVD